MTGISSFSMGAARSIVIEGIRIPAGFRDLEAFRRWVRSDDFPESGRIDWVGGDIEVDMSPEELNTHSALKTAIAGGLWNLIEGAGRGVVYIDSTRISSPAADLSAEPDVVVLLRETADEGKVKLVPKKRASEGRFVEIEGPVDLVVECVSDSSVRKDLSAVATSSKVAKADRNRLSRAYDKAGMGEYWIADGRVDPVGLTLRVRGPAGWVESPADAEGFRRSELLGLGVRIARLPVGARLVRYRLETR